MPSQTIISAPVVEWKPILCGFLSPVITATGEPPETMRNTRPLVASITYGPAANGPPGEIAMSSNVVPAGACDTSCMLPTAARRAEEYDAG